MVSGGEISHLDTAKGSDGKEYPRQVQHKPVAVFNPTPREERAIQKPEVVKRLLSGDLKALEEKPHIAQNSGNNEWYTPSEYIDAARVVMGSIDLDPASSDIANEVVHADTYYTAEMDGLTRIWNGRVWLNPPYAGELIPQFINKLKMHVDNGDITEAIVLVNNATETSWFNKLVGCATAIVFPRARVKFYMPDGKTGAPLQGQAVLYCGKNPERFIEVFSPFGWGAFLLEG